VRRLRIDDASRARTMAWVSTAALVVGLAGAVVMLAAAFTLHERCAALRSGSRAR
jgi:hypothetical protein